MKETQSIIENWFDKKQWTPFDWQREIWDAFLDGKSGLLNAPTGSGKTFALFMPTLIRWIESHPDNYQVKKKMVFSCCGSLLSVHWHETWKRLCRR